MFLVKTKMILFLTFAALLLTSCGGGGGGYFGGGRGSRQGDWLHRGGGGGSGYIHPSVVGGATTAGSGITPPNTADTNYPGGSSGYGANPGVGGNAFIWISEESPP